MAAIFDFMLHMNSDSTSTSQGVLPDLKNSDIVVEMSLISRIQAEIYVLSYALPVHGGHFWFVTYAEVGQFPNLLHHVAEPQ